MTDEKDILIRALTLRVSQLEQAVYWALGENGEFSERPKDKGPYWWRTQLRALSKLPVRREAN